MYAIQYNNGRWARIEDIPEILRLSKGWGMAPLTHVPCGLTLVHTVHVRFYIFKDEAASEQSIETLLNKGKGGGK